MNKEERRAYDRDYWQKNKAKRNAQKRENYRENIKDPVWKEKRLAYSLNYKKEIQYPKHRQSHIKKVNEWRKVNPERIREYQRKTNSRRKYDPDMYEYHRLIILIEEEAR